MRAQNYIKLAQMYVNRIKRLKGINERQATEVYNRIINNHEFLDGFEAQLLDEAGL